MDTTNCDSLAGFSNRDTTNWRVRATTLTQSKNPIRIIVDDLLGKENPQKELISLAQGDPTAYGHLKPSEEAVSAVVRAFSSGNHDGYTASTGSAACRAAIAAAHSHDFCHPLSLHDVYVTAGCSEALEHCIAVLVAPGKNILLPRPGFPLYETICQRHGVVCLFYDLVPGRGWEVDLCSIRRLANTSTAAILINNPSNPCGAVYSRQHLEEIVGISSALKLPVLADEVYAGMTFRKEFVSLAEFSCSVPMFIVGALSKRWLVPGWRLGWVCVHDIQGNLHGSGVRAAINNLCQISLGPSAPIQAAVPAILATDDSVWLSEIMCALNRCTTLSEKRVLNIDGLSIVSPPEGAMYLLVKIDLCAFRGCLTTSHFAESLLSEESVLVLPGECFRAPGFIRVVTTVPESLIQVAWDRIEAFCKRRFKG
ncbi:tyrosine aminotransferase [Micromonas pusilla CCMP1545]|jgi:tyrosine aminotransferase|uniref:Tyrosine aminotransferase n=1 Tax=Micromonas pusilla (strain CCMP1545) TaxID=564608 RepID=C1MLQ1_MICPC|nr:tyrosine aminotransferase [Micromonas pusilla CCMP1545]EEH59983.1 tyrosine aminotransferase [Micromonas pusilla CCMP1545]|eukprot:XP_003056607.1 tyrosine aminotransferase [Micromonas pusilla CCMP1545]